MSTATALAIQEPAAVIRPNMPQVKTAFSHVSPKTGEIRTKAVPGHYNIIDIEEGTIPRAKQLSRENGLKHCFNGDSLIKALERNGQAFDIVTASVMSDDYLEQAPHPERTYFKILVPRIDGNGRG